MGNKVKTLGPLPNRQAVASEGPERPDAQSMYQIQYRKESWWDRIEYNVPGLLSGEPITEDAPCMPFVGMKRLVDALPDNLDAHLLDDKDWVKTSGNMSFMDVSDGRTELIDDACLRSLSNDALSAAYPGVYIFETDLPVKFDEYRMSMLDYEIKTQLCSKLNVECAIDPPAAPAGYEEKFAQVYSDYKLRAEVYESFRMEQITGERPPISNENPYADTYGDMFALHMDRSKFVDEIIAGEYDELSAGDNGGAHVDAEDAILNSILDEHPVLKGFYTFVEKYAERLPGGDRFIDRVKGMITSNKTLAPKQISGPDAPEAPAGDDLSAQRYDRACSELGISNITGNEKTDAFGLDR